MKKLIWFVLIFASVASAQKNYLTLQDAIDIALEKSYEMKSARLDLLAAEQNLISNKSAFRLRMDMDFNVPSWAEEVRRIDRLDGVPEYRSTGSLEYEGNLDIQQPLPTNGNFGIQSSMRYGDLSFWDQVSQKTNYSKDYYSEVALYFNQPLFTLNRLKTDLKQANLRYEASQRRYSRQQADILYLVTEAFYNLYSATRILEISKTDVDQQEALYELANQKYQAGLIPEVEALQMEVNYSEARNDYVAAQARLERIEDAFKRLIGLNLTDKVGATSDLQIKHIDVNLDRAIDLALKNRSEIRESEIDIENQQLRVKEVDSYRDFQANLSAFYKLVGVSESGLEYNSSVNRYFDSSINDMQTRPNNRGVMLTVSIPIFDSGGNKAAVESERATLRDYELSLLEARKQIQQQVRDVVRTLTETENKLEVNKKREDVAKRAFDITMQRFNNGDITTQELALDRNSFLNAQIAYLQAYIDYQLALADLKRRTMWNFESNSSLVE